MHGKSKAKVYARTGHEVSEGGV